MWKPEHRAAADRRELRYDSALTDAEWALMGKVTRTGACSRKPLEGRPSGRSSRMPPSFRHFGPEGPKGSAGHEVALKVERVVDHGMDREKALLLSLSPSHNLVRILGPIVLAQALLMVTTQAQLASGRSVGAQLVGHKDVRRMALLLEKLPLELQGRPLVPCIPLMRLPLTHIVGGRRC